MMLNSNLEIVQTPVWEMDESRIFVLISASVLPQSSCFSSSLHLIDSNSPFQTQLKPCLFWEADRDLSGDSHSLHLDFHSMYVSETLCLPSRLGRELFAGQDYTGPEML